KPTEYWPVAYALLSCASQHAWALAQFTTWVMYPVVGRPNASLKLGMRKPFDQVPRMATSGMGVNFAPTFGENASWPVEYLSYRPEKFSSSMSITGASSSKKPDLTLRLPSVPTELTDR